ncbi:hypothetical protein SO802_013627 [Lithocarpus litseifolius]|uniref:Neprosin PEP catalytic domain-containing protein n=1 Tax=Lithocarpus litseifolius TaxID=425828 RepID=A0AAW2DBM5_9ROSI
MRPSHKVRILRAKMLSKKLSPGIVAKTTPDKKYKGVSGVMTVWNPKVGPNQCSSVAISAEVGEGPDYTRIQFGWTDPKKESPCWLYYNEEATPIGYFSNKLFTKLSDGVDTLKWGGYVFTQPSDETSPPMGSGKFDNEIYQRTAIMINVRYIDNKYHLVDSPNDIQTAESRCYFGDHSYKDNTVGYTFCFGGKGGTQEECISGL